MSKINLGPEEYKDYTIGRRENPIVIDSDSENEYDSDETVDEFEAFGKEFQPVDGVDDTVMLKDAEMLEEPFEGIDNYEEFQIGDSLYDPTFDPTNSAIENIYRPRQPRSKFY